MNRPSYPDPEPVWRSRLRAVLIVGTLAVALIRRMVR